MKYQTQIINDLKSKKGLHDLSESYLASFLKIVLSKELAQKFDAYDSFDKLKRTNLYSDFFKDARVRLRKIYGIFKDEEDREQMLERKNYDAILQSHQSTRERFPDYTTLFAKLPDKRISFLDLGSGLNPIAAYMIKDKIREYHAGEISKDDVDLINAFFRQENIKGKAFIFDLVDGDFSKLPAADYCLLFKVLDALEILEENISMKVLKAVPCRTIIVSFTTKSISGKKPFRTNRSWLERIVRSLSYTFEAFETENELFYIIRKP